MTHQVYLAGPWFNQDQLDRLNSVREVLTENEISFYDPQKDCLYVPGKISALEVLDMNTSAIDAANFIVCITDVKIHLFYIIGQMQLFDLAIIEVDE